MPIVNRIAEFRDEMTAWRRDLHRFPELAFEEVRTSDFVADKLGEWGIEVHRGLAKTGVVGVVRGQRDSGRAIGLRADMDALPIQELNTFAYASRTSGKMHACGHDGHTTMLLGAAKYLAETRNFAGTVYLIFQPAEEHFGGGRVMVEEGLFKQFPMEAVYGLHNMPGVPLGEIAMRPGAAMAATDTFEIRLTGQGAHAAMPNRGVDPIMIAAQIVTAVQTIASRRVDPVESVVLTVTQVHGGDAWNVIPETVTMRGTARTLIAPVRDQVQEELRRIVAGIAEAHGAKVEIDWNGGYPPTVNDAAATDFAARVAAEVVGGEKVTADAPPLMGAEDFSYMLQEKPGCYIWLGNGVGEKGGRGLHNPHYDFNDDAAALGASYWARLVETALPRP